MIPATSSRTRKHAPPAVRREQILDAAQACFAGGGYHRTTMDQIVAASGLSKGSLYWHFENKEEMLLALFDRYVGEFFSAWGARTEEAPSVAANLRDGAALFCEMILTKRDLAQTWLGFLEHPQARERLAALYVTSRAALTAVFEAGIARGELRPVPSASLAAAVTGLADGVLLQALVDETFDPVPPLRDATDALLKGISR